MTKPANIRGIEAATKISWSEWLRFLNGVGAKNLPHSKIASKAYEKMKEDQASPGWWSQSIAVAYEQQIGRRQPGQRADGTYEVTVSKTLPGTMDVAMKKWIGLVMNKNEFSGVKTSGEPKTSITKKWRYWRVDLADGTSVNVSTFKKSESKAGIAVTNMKLKDIEDVENWRLYWKKFLQKLS